MFGLSALPALARGFGMCYLPSSPRFLLIRQRELEARAALFITLSLFYCRRLMFGLSAIPALAQGIGMCYLPSSPRFLLMHKRQFKARTALFI